MPQLKNSRNVGLPKQQCHVISRPKNPELHPGTSQASIRKYIILLVFDKMDQQPEDKDLIDKNIVQRAYAAQLEDEEK